MTYNADGQLQTTEVPGTSYTGLYAADGSYNIVTNSSSSYVGLFHPCGALNAFLTTNPDAGPVAPNGSAYKIAKGAGFVLTQPQGNRSYT